MAQMGRCVAVRNDLLRKQRTSLQQSVSILDTEGYSGRIGASLSSYARGTVNAVALLCSRLVYVSWIGPQIAA